MNKEEFMSRLATLLQDVPQNEREEALQYYRDYLEDACGAETEDVCSVLGTPEHLAQEIRVGLGDENGEGEFTENGYRRSGSRYRRNEVAPLTEGKKIGAEGYDGNPGNAYYQQKYYEETGGKGVYGDRSLQAAGKPQKGKMSGGTIALLIVLAILTSPLWIALLAVAFAIVVSVFAVLFSLLLVFFLLGISLLVAGAALVVGGIKSLIYIPAGGLCMLGSALMLLALGIVSIWLMVLLVVKGIPILGRGCKSLWNRLFHKGGKKE